MLSEKKLNLIQQFVADANRDEIIWTSGYLAGLSGAANVASTGAVALTAAAPAPNVKPLVLYATETGNAKKVASQLLATFKKNKITAKASDVAQFDIKKLAKETHVFFVVSTQGEGELPQSAIPFFDVLEKSDLKLDNISYSVLGLGDSSYPIFCGAAEIVDEIMAKKSAKSISPLVKADVDFDATATAWEQAVLAAINQSAAPAAATVVAANASGIPSKKTYLGQLSAKVILNDKGSLKETYHLEFSADEEILYTPGDVLGIVAKNTPADVELILNHFKANTPENAKKLAALNIKALSQKSIEKINQALNAQLEGEKLDLVDVLPQISGDFAALAEVLLPIGPRLYSISSSPEAHDGEVHLTVNLNKFQINGINKTGLASQFLADLPLNQEVEFYIQYNPHFKLPADDQDIIMVGPGTGIAPFRSFIAHRDATGAEGKNWLFFGEQHFVSDFYYQTEIQEWLSTGVLTKFDVAFSRDQAEKIYVQDRIKQQAKEFNQWLQNGASLYICGQKAPMSVDVQNTIIEVIAQERKISTEAAAAVLEQLEADGKLHKDVY